MFDKKDLNFVQNNTEKCNGQKKIIAKRQRVNDLYFKVHLSKRSIIKQESMSSYFVVKWTQSPNQNMTEDHRGWEAGNRRKWTDETEKRIHDIHHYLTESEDEYFNGPTAVNQIWLKRYDDPPPPLRTIGRIIKELGLSTQTKSKRKGAAKYLRYPENTIYGGYLGHRVMEADFIQRRYIQGSGQPLHFVGFSGKQDPKFRNYKRIESLTVDQFLQACDEFLEKFDKPDVLKLDNAATFIGSMSGKRNISKVMLYLLERQIIPVFSVPRKPFSQGSIEGNNSVFSRFFWNRRHFESINDLDRKLESFNAASLRYSGYEKPEAKIRKKEFIPKVCFLRQIRESDSHPGEGMVNILNEAILLSSEWINYFIIAEWNLSTQKLTVSLEENNELISLKHMDFEINKDSCKKLKNSVALSFDH